MEKNGKIVARRDADVTRLLKYIDDKLGDNKMKILRLGEWIYGHGFNIKF